MKRVHIVPNSQMEAHNPAAIDDPGLAGTENYRAGYVAVVNLVYGREKLSDVSGNEWGFRVIFQLLDAMDSPIATDSVTVQAFPVSTIYLDQRRHLLDTGHVKLVVKRILTTDDNWATHSTDWLTIIKNIPDDIRLELQIETNRFDFLDQTEPVTGLSLSMVDQDLLMEWDHMPGAESYEIELGFATANTHPEVTTIDTFRTPVRIEVNQNHHRIPATYPDGTLYVRVRSVGRFIRNGLTDPGEMHYQSVADWSVVESISVNFAADQNWQATTTYAEEGKYKKVVEYHDDGLKKRQIATNLSTDNTIIRATTHYDFEGRPVINVLPAPDLSSGSLEYIEGLNELEPEVFEDQSASHELGTDNGAGLYYDPANPATQGVHSSYIPDAEGYPYSQIKYLNDGTGRVAAQSGVGAQYQLGTGRETQFYYDDASDTQLRRLFGQNVGAAKYYKRHISQDPDSQLTVAYIDPMGNTIATALAGRSPSNVHKLKSELPEIITENLMENNVVDTLTGVSQLTTTIFNELPGLIYVFKYALTGLVVEHLAEVCKSCTYQLELHIIAPDGNEEHGDTILFTHEDLCEDETFTETLASFTDTFDVVGLYTVTKRLTVIPPTMEEWLALLDPVLPDSAYFAELYLSQIDTTVCIQSCDQFCRDTILAAHPMLSGAALDSAIQDCVYRNCLDTLYDEAGGFLCDAMLDMMIQQLKEGNCEYDEWSHPDSISHLTFSVDGEPVAGEDLFDAMRNGTIIWEDSWEDTLAMVHPDYCCYEFCLEMESSRGFDLRAPFLFSWDDVVGDFDFLVSVDPFFISGPGSVGSHAATMTDWLENYGTNEMNENVEGCGFPDGIPVNIIQLIECIMGDSLPEVKWGAYLSMYQGLKEKMVNEIYPCPEPLNLECTACLKIPASFMEIDTADEAISFVNDSLAVMCNDICAGQATIIADMIFESCEGIEYDSLYNHLYNHCTMVCGFQNPLGVLLEEDINHPSFQDLIDYLGVNGCDTMLFDSLFIIPFVSVYIPLGYPQNAGISVIDTICNGDSINLFILHDSLYVESLDSLLAIELLGGQLHLLDSGMYYFLGYDPNCGQLAIPQTPVFGPGEFAWFDQPMVWEPGTPLGAWPEISGLEDAGCYTFGFYTPSMPGACSDYSEVTIFVPECDSVSLELDSFGLCAVAAHLAFGDNADEVDTVIWDVTINGNPFAPYMEGDTIYEGSLYIFTATIAFLGCCDTLVLTDTLECIICDTCNMQTLEVCDERFETLVTHDGDTVSVGFDFQCRVSEHGANNIFADQIEDLLIGLGDCGDPMVIWDDLNDSTCTEGMCPCPCLRFTILNSGIRLNYITGSAGTYYFDTTGCSDPIPIVSPDEIRERAFIELYPNPAKSSFHLEFHHPYEINGDFLVQIADFSGTLYHSAFYPSVGDIDKVEINSSNIPPGVYKVVVKDAQGHYSSTIIIMRQ